MILKKVIRKRKAYWMFKSSDGKIIDFKRAKGELKTRKQAVDRIKEEIIINTYQNDKGEVKNVKIRRGTLSKDTYREPLKRVVKKVYINKAIPKGKIKKGDKVVATAKIGNNFFRATPDERDFINKPRTKKRLIMSARNRLKRHIGFTLGGASDEEVGEEILTDTNSNIKITFERFVNK